MHTIINIAIWVVLATALIVFCVYQIYWAGYKSGARMVLADWTKSLQEEEEK